MLLRPAVVTPPGDARSSLVLHGVHKRSEVLQQVEAHGAVILTGFDRSSHPLHFAAFARSLSLRPFESTESAAPRTEVAPDVFTANEAPPTEKIPFHHEMAQCSSFPNYVLFFCERPAASRGSTPIVLSRDVAAHVRARHPGVAREMDERGIRYARTLPAQNDESSPIGRSWRNTYGSTVAEAEAALAKAGMAWEWKSNGDLYTLSSRKPLFGADHLGRPTFFNSAVAARIGWNDARNQGRHAIVYGDNAEPLVDAADTLLRDARAYMDSHAFRHPWATGDVMLLDNRQILHARETFSGPRRVLASMWS